MCSGRSVHSSSLIKTRGYQVWPREIEDVIATHPAVAEVGVAKMPDAVKGEVAKAWVVLRPGASTTAGEIRAYCHEHLAPYKVPAVVVFQRALPRTLLGGKVLPRMLGSTPAGQHLAVSRTGHRTEAATVLGQQYRNNPREKNPTERASTTNRGHWCG